MSLGVISCSVPLTKQYHLVSEHSSSVSGAGFRLLESGLKSSQIGAGYSHKLWATTAPACFAGRSALLSSGFVAVLAFPFLLWLCTEQLPGP